MTLKELITELLALSERIGPDAEVQVRGEEYDWVAAGEPYGLLGRPGLVRIDVPS
jgi:hypothetical protein